MKKQANSLYDALDNFSIQTKCKEKDELVHVFYDFLQLSEEKLAKIRH